MVSSPRIDFNSLWILKGDLTATFADPFELITMNFLNGDQPAKGDTLIKVGRSSAFLLLATEAAPRAASVQGFFATSGCGEGSEVFFFGFIGGFKYSAPGPPTRHGAQPGGHVARHSSAVSGLPWSYTPSRGCGTSTGIDPSPIHRKMTSRLGSVDSTWEEREVEDSRRRSRRDDSAGKQVGIEDKSQVEKEMSPCPDERQSIGNNLPWSPLTTRGNHGGTNSSPGPTRGMDLRI
ncbi:hypothetical protein PoB_007354500 [Plakobranchus ocellatus]|uniref:Uncharacterized protein n=1 Tax=Plakobranchus ocellatus TaxID=259542 RepID=A0AAV4DSN4_9GAST|nr:hypothetical protein PoB_007354500 [Plakobranchus ocellatus]